MGSYYFLLLFSLASGVWTTEQSNAEPVKFVLTFPTIWRIARDFDFHLVLFENPNYTLPVVFIANFTLSGDVIASQTFQQASYGYERHTFKNIAELPELSAGDEGEDELTPEVTVTFESDGMKDYTDITSEPTRLQEKFVFIQTDKAIYKPAQNVKIRVVAIDRDLKALASSSVSVSVIDANENTIQEWTDQVLQNGMLSTNFTMSDLAALGDWTVKVKGKNLPENEKTFTVQQYVLPKYEVKMDLGSYWSLSSNESNYKGYVKAKYTFGKPIRGKADIALTGTGGCGSSSYGSSYSIYDEEMSFDDFFSSWMLPSTSLLNITVNLTGDGSAEDGAFTWKGLNSLILLSTYDASGDKEGGDNSTETTTLSLPNGYDSCNLIFEVNVTEELSGEVIKSSGSVTLYDVPYAIKVHESVQKTLKPGLPFTMRFEVTKPDGSSVTDNVELLIMVYHDVTSPRTSYSRDKCYAIKYDSIEHTHFVIENITARALDGIVTVVVTPPQNASTTAFLATIPTVPDVKLCQSYSPPQSYSSQSVSISIDRQPSKSKSIPKVGERMKFLITASYKTTNAYFLLSQNGQVFLYQTLTAKPPLPTDNVTVFSVEITLPQEAAPRASAIAWTVETTSNEILADAVEFKVDGLVRQKVTAAFVPSSVRPREQTALRVKTSEPNATVALLAVDKSVRLLKGGNDVALDDVLVAVGAGSDGTVSPVLWRCWSCDFWPWWIDSSSAESVFNGVGMTIKSNAITEQKSYWSYYNEKNDVLEAEDFEMDAGVVFDKAERTMPSPKEETDNYFNNNNNNGPDGSVKKEPPVVRKNFPESWIWEIVRTNANGEFVGTFQAADTITTWVLSALAVGGKNGFGALETPAELTVFQDFFVNLDISHPTIIRGEQVEIKAIIFNYRSEALTVDTLLKQSPDFQVSIDDGKTFGSRNFTKSVVVPANGGSSVSIWIKPKKLGNINLELSGIATGNAKSADAMRKEVTVEAEGELRYTNKALLIRLTGDSSTLSTIKQTISVNDMLGDAAKNVVSGSKFIQLQTMGDILGPALANLGSQIRLPTGCGEQTMVTLAPNVYIYKYLKSAGTLTSETEQRAIGFVDKGYQHELTYQREDGGFSAFGNSDSASSTWLTAFVIRCFHAASKYMNTQISSEIFAKTWKFLKSQSKTDGLFAEPGRVLHASMKGGGATSDVNLATYIYTTWAEAGGLDDYGWASSKATRKCVVEAGTNATNKDSYQLALTAYALSILLADKPTSLSILRRLITMATYKDGFLYWELPAANKTGSRYWDWEPTGPTQIETASYALLAMMNHGQTENAINVARWLLSKRNSLGGFISTQDTVVGLQALAQIAPILSSRNMALNISANLVFERGANISASFRIQPENARILQTFDPDRQRQNLKFVEISFSGSGVGLVQLAMKYNIQSQKLLDSGDFAITIVRETMARKKRETAAPSGQLKDPDVQLKACTKPVTLSARTGMVVMEIGVPTGFEVDIDATQTANKVNDIYKAPLKMIEPGDRKIIYYFDSLEDNLVGHGACVVGKITRKTAATNVQPPMARVYSYYAPSRSNATQFAFHGMSLDDPLIFHE